MKKAYLIALFCSLLVLPAMSQTQLLLDTAYGGQQQATISCRLVILPGDTVNVRTEWSVNATFVPLFAEAYEVFMNTDTVQDTIIIAHTVDSIIVPAVYHIRMYVVSDSDTVTTAGVAVTVTPLFVVPTISIAAPTPSGDGGSVPFTVNTGNTNGVLKIFMSPGDTNFATVYLVDTVVLSNTIGTYNYVFTGLPNQYYFSYKFVIENSVGSDTSAKGWILTLPSGSNPWISNVDSVHAGIGAIDAWWSLVTNGINCSVTTYCRKTGTAQVDSVVQSFVGQAGVTAVYASFASLLENTSYDVWSCVSGGNCGAVLSVTTLSAPILLSLSIDTAVTTGFDTELFAAVCTTETNASVWIEVADQSDPNFFAPFIATPLMLSSQGISTLSIDGVSNHFLDGVTYLARARGFNVAGESASSPTYSFVFNYTTTGVGVVEDVYQPFDWRNNNTVVWKGEQADVSITDMSGRVVEKRQMQTGDSWNLGESIASGVYLIHYGSGTKKVVTQ